MRNLGTRICLFIGTLGSGGAERVIAWLANRLVEQGASVAVVTFSDPRDDVYVLDDRVSRYSLGLHGPNTPFAKPWINIRRILSLMRVFRATKSDTVLAFMPHESILAILAGRMSGSRVVISERNAPWRRSAGRPWNTLRRYLYRFSHVQIAQTKQIALWLEREAVCRNVRIVPNAALPVLPTNDPPVPPPLDLMGSRRLVLAVGTKAHQKGFDTLIQAFSAVANEFPKWDLAIVGLEPERLDGGISGADIAALVQSADLSGRVHFPGKVGNMLEWYAAADLFVLSSRFEGFPNVLLEAMSQGCPVLSTNCDTGPQDVVKNGKNGILVDVDNANALKQGLIRTMRDPDLRNRIGCAAREVSRIYSEARITDLWIAALTRCKKA